MPALRENADTLQAFNDVTHLAQQYFELVFTNDLALFDQVFDPAAQLYSLTDGQLVVRTCAQYREILRARTPPRSVGSPREDELIQIDLASPTQALLKLKVRISEMVFIDYLTLLKLEQGWRIVSKIYHRV
jgi:hypothetical protein